MYEPCGLTALIVDDDSLSRDLLVEYLHELGLNYEEAPNGIVALSKTRSIIPDIILLDIDMPRGDGISLLKQIRNERCDKPVIMITSHNSADKVREAMVAGATDYVVKPISIDTLKERLEKILSIDFKKAK